MNSLMRTSFITLGILFSFVFFIVILIGIYLDAVSIQYAIILTIIINGITWLVGPTISDFIYQFVYKTRFYTHDEFVQEQPELATFIQSICTRFNFPFPKMGLINDRNPTAFTYGSHQGNARIIITEGILHYLSPEEVQAVIAHELGHVYHRDFIVMTIAVTLVQILYEIYARLIRIKSRGRKKGNPLILIAVLSYVLYLIGTYLLLFLSRTREYYADHFAVEVTKAPQAMTQALMKIAYGIVETKDTETTTRLLESTRSMGLIDVKHAANIGTAMAATHDMQILGQVISFDIVSPWAQVLELNSTHPLTGKRIMRLQDMAQHYGQQVAIDFRGIIAGMHIDRSRLYHNFYSELTMFLLPALAVPIGFVLMGGIGILISFTLANIVRMLYQMPEVSSEPSTVLDQMKNPYASPMKGAPVQLDGMVVGRGIAGYVLSEDMMFQDKTGIIHLNFAHLFGGLGNLFFALKKVEKLIGQHAVADGWFFRGLTHSVTLRKLKTEQETITSHPKFWSITLNLILFFIGLILLLRITT